jgi:hypothetical protein
MDQPVRSSMNRVTAKAAKQTSLPNREGESKNHRAADKVRGIVKTCGLTFPLGIIV